MIINSSTFSSKNPFNELAWAAFYFANVYEEDEFEDPYLSLINDHSLISRLRNNPVALDLKADLEEKVIQRYLNGWNCRIAGDDHARFASHIKHVLTAKVAISSKFRNVRLENVRLDSTASDEVRDLFQALITIQNKGIAATIAAKILHLILPDILPPWDKSIADALKTKHSADGYIEYLEKAQKDARSITDDFQFVYGAHRGSPECYLSRKLGFTTPKSLPKFLDEYYWLKFTEQIEIPPSWWPSKD